jgi:hypothetical protein
MNAMTGFIIGLLAGAALGFILCALLAGGND